MLQIEKERSLAYPNQLPAGPRKKRPLGRLFSSNKYFVKNCRLQETRRSESVSPVPKTTLLATLQTLELQGGEGGQTLQEATLQDTTLLAD